VKFIDLISSSLIVREKATEVEEEDDYTMLHPAARV
jgi:hypothetical protein